jgi:hypothetical protein
MELFEMADLCTPWCVHVAATLRIADHIAAGQAEIGALAEAAGADRESLYRMLQHLVSKGVFEEPASGQFALNDLARGFLEAPNRLGLSLDGIGGRMAGAWGTLLPAVRTGRPAYHEAFGRPFWEDLDAHPEVAASFDALMGPGHGTPDPEILVNAADWASTQTVVDVGGGTGSLLAEVLRARQAVRGILVDLPRVVAHAGEVFAAAGVADRATARGQSFFDALPGGGDLYVLKSVISDWPDREATAILKRCAEAARPAGRVVVFTGEKGGPEMLMLVLLGGKGRSLEEFRAIARAAGLEVSAVGRQPTGRTIVECRPV